MITPTRSYRSDRPQCPALEAHEPAKFLSTVLSETAVTISILEEFHHQRGYPVLPLHALSPCRSPSGTNFRPKTTAAVLSPSATATSSRGTSATAD
jgi:hypothetical protein